MKLVLQLTKKRFLFALQNPIQWEYWNVKIRCDKHRHNYGEWNVISKQCGPQCREPPEKLPPSILTWAISEYKDHLGISFGEFCVDGTTTATKRTTCTIRAQQWKTTQNVIVGVHLNKEKYLRWCKLKCGKSNWWWCFSKTLPECFRCIIFDGFALFKWEHMTIWLQLGLFCRERWTYNFTKRKLYL